MILRRHEGGPPRRAVLFAGLLFVLLLRCLRLSLLLVLFSRFFSGSRACFLCSAFPRHKTCFLPSFVLFFQAAGGGGGASEAEPVPMDLSVDLESLNETDLKVMDRSNSDEPDHPFSTSVSSITSSLRIFTTQLQGGRDTCCCTSMHAFYASLPACLFGHSLSPPSQNPFIVSRGVFFFCVSLVLVLLLRCVLSRNVLRVFVLGHGDSTCRYERERRRRGV